MTDEIAEAGFTVLQQRRDGSVQYGLRPHAYLTYWLTTYPNGVAELTWELSLGQFLRDRGLAVSGQDELSLLVFPSEEIRGMLEPGFVRGAIDRVEAKLASLDFVTGT